ncbi:MAG: hypothetical protein KC591_05730 [Gemmatimonadetes bacterium]|nr:hypothetical protein [Gemmatimonadota bacterium]
MERQFRFRRLEKHGVGGTEGHMELEVPAPQSDTGKRYRECPSERCEPRTFLLGQGEERGGALDCAGARRRPGEDGTTCPYCGLDAPDDRFDYEGDLEEIQKYVEWAVLHDTADYMDELARDFNRSTAPLKGLLGIEMKVKSPRPPRPSLWREDLLRNIHCGHCGRSYGVYAIALFCPDCGLPNLRDHFDREVELVEQQVRLAREVQDRELAYRLLGNAHEDVLTAMESFQKAVYRFLLDRRLPNRAAQLGSGKAVKNRFQNDLNATRLWANLDIDPFAGLTKDELELLRFNVGKRHVVGHNLSMSDESYAATARTEPLGRTVSIVADDVSRFAELCGRVIDGLEVELKTHCPEGG